MLEVHEEGAFGDPFEGTLVWIITAHQWGPFDVRARVLDSAPTASDDMWEDVSEVSLDVDVGLYVTDVMDDGPGMALDLAPGPWRVRVSARGRASDWWELMQKTPDGGSSRPAVEHYLMEVWPAPPSPPQDVRESNTYALATRSA